MPARTALVRTVPVRTAVLGTALLLTGCGSTVPGTAAPGGALLDLAEDVDLGIAYTGGGGRLEFATLDSADRPVLLASAEFATPPGLTRGTDLSTGAPIAALGEFGFVSAMAVTPDDTVVLVAESEDIGPSIVRIAPDGTETVLPLGLPDVVDPFSASVGSTTGEGIAFSPDASLVALTDVPTDVSQGFPESAGTLQVAVLDTATGTALEVIEVQLQDPAGVIPGEERPLTIEDAAVAADGSVSVAVGFAGADPQLLRFDAGLAASGPAVTYGRPDDGGRTFLTLDDRGNAYLLTSGDGVALLRVPTGAEQPEVVATLIEGSGSVSGLAVDPAGWAYVTGLTDIELGQTVVAVDLAGGTVLPATGLCRNGFSEPPVLGASGGTLLVSARCSDVTTNQEHLYLLRGA